MKMHCMMHIEKTNEIILDNTKNVEADSHPASKKLRMPASRPPPLPSALFMRKENLFEGFLCPIVRTR